jgi:hypothetical protein
MRHRVRTIGLHEDRACVRSRAVCRELRGPDGEAQRAAEIASLDSKDWRGHTVYRLICRGDYGKGNHECWIPERVLWALISFDAYRCAFHQ